MTNKNHVAGWIISFVLLSVLLPFYNLHSQEAATFSHQMHELEKSFGGRLGIMAKNLRTGEVLAYAAEKKFPTASVIKVLIMVEYFYQVSEGKIAPTQKMTLGDANKWGGSGLLQYFSGTTEQQLIDAVMLMITISDNTATNLVIDALGKTHEEKLAAVNERMQSLGLKNTQLLNKVMSWKTKKDTPESIRYGIGVSTPEDMVILLEKMYKRELVDSVASRAMIDLMKKQEYNDMIPRFLPFENTPGIEVAHKTGSVTAVRVDAGLILAPQADLALAIFCDQIQDRRGGSSNAGTVAAAKAARIAWNHFVGDSGLDRPFITAVDWNSFPSGEWTRIFLKNSPFPHLSRQHGYRYQEIFFPADSHYLDSSAVIVIPKGFHESKNGADLIIHFHGWNNDNLNVMEEFNMVQQLMASNKNAILVFAQGPYRASDSGGGKMEDEGGMKQFVEEILTILASERKINHPEIGKIIITAHSGGYRPAILSLVRGGLQDHIKEIFLFDAFYAETEQLIPWLKQDKHNRLRSIYTQHLAVEHESFINLLKNFKLTYSEKFKSSERIVLSPTDLCHNCVIENVFQIWIEGSCLDDRGK
ncbi:MAG: class A beta-lactamase-related serine hydrolase [bacterium]|nr:class A beta-lactamase-related serine hydrolase [bacterium]